MSRRYQRPFYYKERMQQWCCQEPKLDEDLLDSMVHEMESGRFGPQNDLSRGDIFLMLRENGWSKYKENWKTILRAASGRDLRFPDDELVEKCTRLYHLISRMLEKVFHLLCGSKGKPRKNMMHVNYVHRKILESQGILEWHREFPLLRTPTKVAELDDAAEEIFHKIGIPFTRTAIVLIPKCRQKIKRRFKVCDNLEKVVGDELQRIWNEAS